MSQYGFTVVIKVWEKNIFCTTTTLMFNMHQNNSPVTVNLQLWNQHLRKQYQTTIHNTHI